METVSSSGTVTLVEIKHSLIPKKWGESVRIVDMSECQQVAISLAHAFAADDLACYLLDSDDMAGLSPEEKWKLHVDIFQYIVAAHCLNGETHVIGPDHEGVALWMPPGKNIDDWYTVLRSGMWRLYFQLSSEGRQRYYNEMLPLLHDTKAEVLGERDDNAYYLVYLGTKPHARGRGYAGKLLRTMIARADAENRPVYLESSSLANNAYYAKFGFVVKKEIFLKRGAVPVQLTIMVREPQPAAKVANVPVVKRQVRTAAPGGRVLDS
ncbi:n-acetyltransferase-like protein [Diaporthe eres]|uniref:N-acetyltransferase domain-containing protein n=1 Tax=Diaporthe vaccinii TaxID=105482 RepID=A0ABR4EGW2_9PEZI|nr:n-acetyltransferase-like protein [Diaporthe eres]